MFKYKSMAALVALACAQTAVADSAVTRLDEVVVTATRVPEKLAALPVTVTVVTAEQIAQSTARTVQDVLSGLAGVQVRNNTGSADSTMVDLRGFGLTGISNTLVLIDGVKQNINDLSAPDLGSVPLSEVARIEVIRGSGAVAYGGGATGGVINIITRGGFNGTDRLQATLTAGSYNLKKLELAGHVAGEQVALDGYVKSMTSDNYRRNNAERHDGAGLGVTVRHADGDIRLYARSSNKDLRLPGGRSEAEFAQDPRGTSSPNDFMDVRMQSVGVQARQALADGMLYLDAAYRSKDTKAFQWGSTSTYALTEQSQSLRYEKAFGAHRLVVGADALQGGNDVNNAFTGKKRVEQQQLGAFADLLWQPVAGSRVDLGMRNQRTEDKVTGSSKLSVDKEVHAWHAGVRQALTAQLDAYAKVGRSFRFANADEQGYTLNNVLLLPQTSRDYELGLAWQQAGHSVQASAFRYNLENEIGFSQSVYRNVNLAPTQREGIELAGKTALRPTVQLDANLTLQRATFRQGDLAGKEVPLVARQLANVGISWQPQEATRLGLQLQYVGKQRVDGDQDNQSTQRLSAYTVVNAKISHRYSKQLSLALDVNNLTNRRYATYGGTWGDRYPAAGRNLQVSATVNY